MPDAVYLHVTRTAAALLFTPEVVVRLPLTERAGMRMKVDIANLRSLGPRPRPLVPDLIAEGQFQRQAYLVTHAFPGVSGARVARRPRNLAAILQQATGFITRFHRETIQDQVCSEEWLQENFDWLVDYIDKLGGNVAELKSLCRRDLLSKRVQTVTAHGDFTLQNLVVDPRSCRLTGVVDWDLVDTGGWPGMDLLHLFVVLEYETRGCAFNEALPAVLKRLRDNPGIERDLFNSYLAALRPDSEQVVWAVQRYILRVIHDKHMYGDGKIAPLIAALDTELAAARLLTREWLEMIQRDPMFSAKGPVHFSDFSVSADRLAALAKELSLFTGRSMQEVTARLESELRDHAGCMAKEWMECRPITARQIERFYEETDAYLYELLIDGEDPFRNQTRNAMMEALRKSGAQRVFEFGGGIGTDAMWFARAGLQWTYYDLPGGQTFRFASWRFQEQQVPVTVVTHPGQSRDNDAVISVEVFEHLPNLLAALRDINRTVRLGGLLIFSESFGKTERHPLHLTRTAIQGRFLNELAQAAGFEPVHRFGPEDYFYRTIKRREPTPFDWLLALALVAGRVAHKIPVKLWRALAAHKPVRQPELP